MDRMLYLSMTGAKQTMVAQSLNANNLANVSTPAFKADLEQFRSMPVFGEGHPSRVYAMAESPGLDFTPGAINTTGRELDIAIRGEGWIAVQAPDGSEAYTRTGNLRVSSAGLLVTGAGHPVLGNGGAPIAIPQAEKIEIGSNGVISIVPIGQGANELAVLDQVRLVNPDKQNLTKGEDGLVHLKAGDPPEPDIAIRVVSGSLEGSNVNAVSAMVDMITLSRSYEMQVKMMKTAEENDTAVTQIMKLA